MQSVPYSFAINLTPKVASSNYERNAVCNLYFSLVFISFTHVSYSKHNLGLDVTLYSLRKILCPYCIYYMCVYIYYICVCIYCVLYMCIYIIYLCENILYYICVCIYYVLHVCVYIVYFLCVYILYMCVYLCIHSSRSLFKYFVFSQTNNEIAQNLRQSFCKNAFFFWPNGDFQYLDYVRIFLKQPILQIALQNIVSRVYVSGQDDGHGNHRSSSRLSVRRCRVCSNGGSDAQKWIT
jgi:hypothetical protein